MPFGLTQLFTRKTPEEKARKAARRKAIQVLKKLPERLRDYDLDNQIKTILKNAGPHAYDMAAALFYLGTGQFPADYPLPATITGDPSFLALTQRRVPPVIQSPYRLYQIAQFLVTLGPDAPPMAMAIQIVSPHFLVSSSTDSEPFSDAAYDAVVRDTLFLGRSRFRSPGGSTYAHSVLFIVRHSPHPPTRFMHAALRDALPVGDETRNLGTALAILAHGNCTADGQVDAFMGGVSACTDRPDRRRTATRSQPGVPDSTVTYPVIMEMLIALAMMHVDITPRMLDVFLRLVHDRTHSYADLITLARLCATVLAPSQPHPDSLFGTAVRTLLQSPEAARAMIPLMADCGVLPTEAVAAFNAAPATDQVQVIRALRAFSHVGLYNRHVLAFLVRHPALAHLFIRIDLPDSTPLSLGIQTQHPIPLMALALEMLARLNRLCSDNNHQAVQVRSALSPSQWVALKASAESTVKQVVAATLRRMVAPGTDFVVTISDMLAVMQEKFPAPCTRQGGDDLQTTLQLRANTLKRIEAALPGMLTEVMSQLERLSTVMSHPSVISYLRFFVRYLLLSEVFAARVPVPPADPSASACGTSTSRLLITAFHTSASGPGRLGDSYADARDFACVPPPSCSCPTGHVAALVQRGEPLGTGRRTHEEEASTSRPTLVVR
jgi:hypothetical protein